jgi:hypothetical protein
MTDDPYQGDPLRALTDALDGFLGGPWLDGTFTVDMAKAQASEEARKAGYRKSAAQREKDRENRGGRIKRTLRDIPAGYRPVPDEELSHGVKYRRGLSLKAAEGKRKARPMVKVSRHNTDRLQGLKAYHAGYSPPPPPMLAEAREPVARSEQGHYAELIASDAWKQHKALTAKWEAEQETREAREAAFRDQLKNGTPPPPSGGSRITDNKRSWERIPREVFGASHAADRQATIQHAYIIAPTSAAIRATDYSNRPRSPKKGT